MNSAPLQERVSLSGKLLAGLSSHHDTILQTDADCLVLTPIHCKKKNRGSKTDVPVCVWCVCLAVHAERRGEKKEKSSADMVSGAENVITALHLSALILAHHCVVGNRLTACCRHVTAKKLYAEVTADSHGPARESSHNYGY